MAFYPSVWCSPGTFDADNFGLKFNMKSIAPQYQPGRCSKMYRRTDSDACRASSVNTFSIFAHPATARRATEQFCPHHKGAVPPRSVVLRQGR